MNLWLPKDYVVLLVSVAVKSLMLLALVAGAMLAWRRGSGATRHFVWLTALVSLLLLPFVSVMPTMDGPAWINQANQVTNWVMNLTFSADVTKLQRHSTLAAAPERKAFPLAVEAPPAAQAAGTPSRAAMIQAGVVVAWVAGVAITMLGLFIRVRLLRGIERASWPLEDSACLAVVEQERARLGIKRRVRILQSAQPLMPMTWGWWRVVVLLPSDAARWDTDRLRLVVRHELAHVKRWDCLTQGLAQLGCALYWFNPLAWLAAREMRLERERACDDLVLSAGARPSEYAGHLLDVARQFVVAPRIAAIGMARPSNLEQRLRQIVDARRKPARLRPFSALVIAAMFGAGIAFFFGPKISTVAEDINKAATPQYPKVQAFVAAKQKHAQALAKKAGILMHADLNSFFEAGSKGDWQAFHNLSHDLLKRSAQYEGGWDSSLHTVCWSPVLECILFHEQSEELTPKLVEAIGRDIMDSIPAGSIFFGGTDPGRGLPTALSKSHADADPFYTLTQNALADAMYLQYLRLTYGDRIYIPSQKDSELCFNEYISDAQARLKANRLKPGEDVKDEGGRIQVSGQVAVMAINGLLAKVIFDKNPQHEFYVEVSFPLDWMYPHLSPHGMILKVNRAPLTGLKQEDVDRDRKYWESRIAKVIGNWLGADTPVAEVTAFAERVFVDKNLQGFKGDAQWMRNHSACMFYGKMRAAIAGVYAWRVVEAANAEEKKRMTKAADYAFRQALAVCPYSPEAVLGYATLLADEKRYDEAIILAQVAAKAAVGKKYIDAAVFRKLVDDLKQAKATGSSLRPAGEERSSGKIIMNR